MSAVFKRDMVKNRNDTLRLNRKKLGLMYRLPFELTDSTKLLHFTILGGLQTPPIPLNDATEINHERKTETQKRPSSTEELVQVLFSEGSPGGMTILTARVCINKKAV